MNETTIAISMMAISLIFFLGHFYFKKKLKVKKTDLTDT